MKPDIFPLQRAIQSLHAAEIAERDGDLDVAINHLSMALDHTMKFQSALVEVRHRQWVEKGGSHERKD